MTLTVRQATPITHFSIPAVSPARGLFPDPGSPRNTLKSLTDPRKRKEFTNSLLTAADPPLDTSRNWG
ncbi:hypothetical protein RE6C_03275 [Rhodopirellula europaea 6C]|uniref:Uncharacterized protein n=1 Tax=Rhodopirellula europaea 6C TaxID=1263867 RepID=M2ATK9_9BACT|nr:hypothetical protein RE6C_03275 [Rhodopirellula europaea 6C]